MGQLQKIFFFNMLNIKSNLSLYVFNEITQNPLLKINLPALEDFDEQLYNLTTHFCLQVVDQQWLICQIVQCCKIENKVQF